MKKVLKGIRRRMIAVLAGTVFLCCFMTGCGFKPAVGVQVSLHMPAGTNTVSKVSDEEIHAKSDKITIKALSGMPDGEVSLIGADGAASTEGWYISGGMSVDFTVEKGAWYKIRIMSIGGGDKSYDYTVEAEDVGEIRVSSTVNP